MSVCDLKKKNKKTPLINIAEISGCHKQSQGVKWVRDVKRCKISDIKLNKTREYNVQHGDYN